MFVGRSLDSMFDLLSGAFSGLAQPDVSRLPLSFARAGVLKNGQWSTPDLTLSERRLAREILASIGASPSDLARRERPLAFVDVVYGGRTFTELFDLMREWVEEEREPWNVIRKKVRFVGVTSRKKTSPKTWRWHQHAPWTDQLPAGAVVNVSLDQYAWSYFGDYQTKLHRSFRPKDWTADIDGPERDEATRTALSEAVGVVKFGRSKEGRRSLARAMANEPTLAEPWLRSLITHLSRTGEG